MLEALVRESPLVLLLDDLQHADRASLLMLESLAMLVPAWKLAVIAMCREPRQISARSPLQETLFELRRDAACRRFVLDAPDASCERGVFRAVADYWTIVFENRVVRLRDSMGLRYLALLLHRQNQPVHVRELQVAAAGTRLSKRLACTTKAATERARLAVRKSLKAALARIIAAHPALGRHLSVTIRYGYFCTYEDARRPIAWEVRWQSVPNRDQRDVPLIVTCRT